MPRQSKIDRIIETHPATLFEPKKYGHGYLILYSFGAKTNTRFYTDLEKLRKKVKCRKVQRGTIYAEEINDAYSVILLIGDYGGTPTLYEAHELEPYDLIIHYSQQHA